MNNHTFIKFLLSLLISLAVSCSAKKDINRDNRLDGSWKINIEETSKAISKNLGKSENEISDSVRNVFSGVEKMEFDQKSGKILIDRSGKRLQESFKIVKHGKTYLLIETSKSNSEPSEILVRFMGPKSEIMWMDSGLVETKCFKRE